VVKSMNPDDWIREIQDDIKKNGPPQIVLSLIPKQGKSHLYPALKGYLNAEMGIPH